VPNKLLGKGQKNVVFPLLVKAKEGPSKVVFPLLPR
jgi:hypothetical protein